MNQFQSDYSEFVEDEAHIYAYREKDKYDRDLFKLEIYGYKTKEVEE